MSRDIISRITTNLDTSANWYIPALEFTAQFCCWLKCCSTPPACGVSRTTITTWFAETVKNSNCRLELAVFALDTVRQLPDAALEQLGNSLLQAHQRGLMIFEEVPEALATLLNHAKDDQRPWVLPTEIASLMLSLMEMPEGSSLYSPFSHSVSLAAGSIDSNHIATEFNDTSAVSLSTLLLAGKTIAWSTTDPLTQPANITPGGLQQFDYSAGAPQARQRYKLKVINDLYGRFPEQALYGDVIHVRHLLSQTLKRCAIVVSSAMLQRTKGKELLFKRWLLEKNLIKSVIRLPSYCIPGYRNTASILLLDRQEKTTKVTFFDASRSYFYAPGNNGLHVLRNSHAVTEAICKSLESPNKVIVNTTNILNNDTNLDVGRYLSGQKKQATPAPSTTRRKTSTLGDLAELIRAQAIPSNNQPSNTQHAKTHFLEIAPSDINSLGEISNPQKPLSIDYSQLSRAKSQRLKPGDIVLTIKGSTGKIGLTPTISANNWVAGQAFLIIRLKPEAPIKDSRILLQYLRSEAGQNYLSSIRSGTNVAFLQIRDIRQMPIPLLTSEEQNLALESWQKIRQIHTEIELLRKKISHHQNVFW